MKHMFSAMHLSRSAVACAVTAIICVLAGTCLGLFSTVRHQIIFAMITGVCFFASGKQWQVIQIISANW